MAWDKPLYPRKKVNWAGDVRISAHSGAEDRKLAEKIIHNWRRSHNFPLGQYRKQLDKVAHYIDPRPLIFGRIKRLPSIERKLRNEPTMSLSQMQDIGGCRAVVSSIENAYRLADVYGLDITTDGKDRDYIARPKNDGYRGIHLVRRYHDASHPEYENLRIEIQVRTALQHAWATAFEVVEYFTGQTLRRSQEAGDWRRFFLLMSAVLALKEGTDLVPGAPNDPIAVKRELADVAKRGQVLEQLTGFSLILAKFNDAPVKKTQPEKHVYYLLVLSVYPAGGAMLEISPYGKRELDAAMRDYEEAERRAPKDATVNAVLVSVPSRISLRKAYPSYFADTTLFMREISQAVKEGKQ